MKTKTVKKCLCCGAVMLALLSSVIFAPLCYASAASPYPESYQYDSESFYGKSTVMRIDSWDIIDLYAGHKAAKAEFNMSTLYGFVPQILYISQYPIAHMYLDIYGVKANIIVTDPETEQTIANVNFDELNFDTSWSGDDFSFFTQNARARRKFVQIPLHNYDESTTDTWIVSIVIPIEDGSNQAVIYNAIKHTFAFGAYQGVQNYIMHIDMAVEDAMIEAERQRQEAEKEAEKAREEAEKAKKPSIWDDIKDFFGNIGKGSNKPSIWDNIRTFVLIAGGIIVIIIIIKIFKK